MKKLTDDLVKWLREQVQISKTDGAIFGLSGGVDSAVVGALCRRAFGERVLAVIMPAGSNEKDVADARLVAETFRLRTVTVFLDEVWTSFLKLLNSVAGADENANLLAAANLKPRLRMTALYYYANLYNYLVMGTSNKSEFMVGYFTKYGDGGVDIEPLANLVKGQVYRLAEYLQVPQPVIDKTPTAGLWDEQTDEKEMGFSYDVLDNFILTGEAPRNIKEKIIDLYRNSEHKRSLPSKPPF